MAGQRFSSGQVSEYGRTAPNLTLASTTVSGSTGSPYGWGLSGTLTTWAHNANITSYTPAVFGGSWSITNFRINVTTAGSASSTAVIGVYNADYLWQPTTLVAQTSTFAIDSTGVKTVNITASGSAGRFLFAINQSANATYGIRIATSPVGVISLTSGSDGFQCYRRIAETYSATMPATGTAWTTVSTNAGDFVLLHPTVAI
jgi:hypothetical protein